MPREFSVNCSEIESVTNPGEKARIIPMQATAAATEPGVGDMVDKTRVARVGRPEGKGNPSVTERIRRSLPRIYESVRLKAMAGDAAAAQMCVDIVRHPERYPSSDKRP